MRTPHLLLAAALVSPVITLAGSLPRIEVLQLIDTDDAAAELAASNDGDYRLPLLVTFACPAGEEATALSVSVADTMQRTTTPKSPQALTFELKSPRLQGVREAAYCQQPGAQLLENQLAAYATLRCRGVDGSEVSHTTATNLDLWFDCPDTDNRRRPEAGDLVDQ